MANLSTIRPTGVKIPINYPNTPQVGKIQILWDANKRDLYHKISPYGYDTFLGIETRQPFLYKYADTNLSSMAKNASREFPFSRAIEDVERIGKFVISGNGLLWMGKQFLLQTGNAFNETRLYNPVSPLIAAAMPLDLWAFRPQRHIDLSSVSSIVGSFLGPGVGSLFGTKSVPPVGTVGLAGLPPNNQDAGKGLLRAGTSNAAMSSLQNKWAPPSGTGKLGIGKFLGQTIKGLFGNFFPQRQPAGIKRQDQATYGLMLNSFSGETGVFSYQSTNGIINGVQQFWFGGENNGIRKGSEIPLNWKKLYIDETGRPKLLFPDISFKIEGLMGPIGYSVSNTSKAVKYGDYVGTTKNNDWEGSDILIQHSFYTDETKKYPSKLTDKTNPSVVEVNESLKRVIDQLNNTNLYVVDTTDQSSIAIYNQSKIGYDRISAMKKHGDTEVQYRHSVLSEYRNRDVRVLENQHTNAPNEKSLKTASTRQFDGINTLTVLDGDKKIKDVKIPNWTEWKPYNDDLIAFYFYDVVNDKYIPFRATIRGLQETDSANWEELSFIGRADRLYSYSGFNRSLTFNFTVVINSILELAPTWQRINYLMSLIKPASYTHRPDNAADRTLYTRYMVPPMVMLTIGDLYKNQPLVIGSAGITIPDTALWETLNDKNSPEGWSYLTNYIKAPSIGKMYGQLPRTVDISINAYVLEKERAIVGAAHFGHAPHDETYQKNSYRNTAPDFESPTDLHKAMVVYNGQKSVAKPPAME